MKRVRLLRETTRLLQSHKAGLFASSLLLAVSMLRIGTAAQSADASPQLVPRTHEERERRYEQQHRIVLNVQVVDRTGRPFTGLEAEDFALLDNDSPRPIPMFRAIAHGAAERPAQIVLVLDAINNSSKSIASDRAGLERYFKQGPVLQSFPMSIAVVSEAGTRLGTPQRESSALLAQLHDLSANLNPISCADEANQNEAFLSVWMPNSSPSSPGGKHQLECLNERFIRSVTALRTLANRQMDLPGRAIFVWLGPGWPALRDPHFRPDDSTIKANLFQNLVTMTNALREAQVTLNLLSPASLFRKPEDLADPDETHFTFISKAEQVSAANLSLADLAWQSGGQVLENDKEMVDGIEACISDAQTYYQLSFDTPSAADFGELHSLAVRVDKPGLNVRASKLYYAEQ